MFMQMLYGEIYVKTTVNWLKNESSKTYLFIDNKLMQIISDSKRNIKVGMHRRVKTGSKVIPS